MPKELSADQTVLGGLVPRCQHCLSMAYAGYQASIDMSVALIPNCDARSRISRLVVRLVRSLVNRIS